MRYLQLKWSDLTISAIPKINDLKLQTQIDKTQSTEPLPLPKSLYFVIEAQSYRKSQRPPHPTDIRTHELKSFFTSLVNSNASPDTSSHITWNGHKIILHTQNINIKTLLQILESDYVHQVFSHSPSSAEIKANWRLKHLNTENYFARVQEVINTVQTARRKILKHFRKAQLRYQDFQTYVDAPITDPLFSTPIKQDQSNPSNSWKLHQQQRDFVFETLQRHLKEVDDFHFDLQALALTEASLGKGF